MTNDTIKETYKNSKKIPNYTTKDNINLDRENEGYRDLTSVHRIDYKKDPTANSKAYKDSKYIFDGIKVNNHYLLKNYYNYYYYYYL